MDAQTTPILEIGLILLAAVAAGWIARRLHLPAIVGYLAVGLGFSPFTPGYVADHEQLELLADVGVVLLLFEVGIEVDLARLRRDHGAVLLVAPVQVVLSMAIAAVVFLVAGLEPIAAALVGLCVALSSSVVIVNITLSRRRTTDRATDEALLGWAVMQDLVGVGLAAILISLMDARNRSLGEAALGLAGFAIVAILAARLLLPWVLSRLHDEHDLFLITSVGSGLAVAGLGAAIFGVPLALAAFVGGLAVTESHEASEARRRLRPFRDVFAVLFFVAIGTLIDPSQLVPPRLDRPAARARRRRQGGRGVGPGADREARCPAAAARRRPRSDRGVQLRPRLDRPRGGNDRWRAVHGDHRRRGAEHRGQFDRGPAGPGAGDVRSCRSRRPEAGALAAGLRPRAGPRLGLARAWQQDRRDVALAVSDARGSSLGGGTS